VALRATAFLLLFRSMIPVPYPLPPLGPCAPPPTMRSNLPQVHSCPLGPPPFPFIPSEPPLTWRLLPRSCLSLRASCPAFCLFDFPLSLVISPGFYQPLRYHLLPVSDLGAPYFWDSADQPSAVTLYPLPFLDLGPQVSVVLLGVDFGLIFAVPLGSVQALIHLLPLQISLISPLSW